MARAPTAFNKEANMAEIYSDERDPRREKSIRGAIFRYLSGEAGNVYVPDPNLFIRYVPGLNPKPGLVRAIQANRPGQYLSGFQYPKRGYPMVGEPTYSGEKYSGGNGSENWRLEAPSEHLKNARRNVGAGTGGLAMPPASPPDSVAAYARLIRAMLAERSSARPFGASQNARPATSGQGLDNVAL